MKNKKTMDPTGASLRVLKDDSEVRRIIEAAQKTAPIMEPLHFSLRAPDLSENDRKRLEVKIGQIVTTEFKQAQQRIRHEQGKQRKQGERKNIISLKGLPLPDQEIRRIESKVEQEVLEMLPGGLRQQSIVVCGCGWPFGGCCDPPGENIDLSNRSGENPWPPPYPPDGDYLILVCLSEDIMFWKLQDGAAYNLNPDQMLVGLTSRVDWAKEIAAWQVCTCEIAKVHQDSASQSPVWMLLTKDQTETIVFKKPKFFGVWTDMYHIEPTQFWPYLGGKIITVDWLWDANRCGD